MAAAGAALLRSATKMARAPPRLPSALERHGRLPTSSRFSTFSGSTPPPPNFRGSQTHNNKVPSGSLWDRAMTVAIETSITCAVLTVFGGIIVKCWVNPALDHIEANLEASSRLDKEIRDEIKHGHQRLREQWASSKS